MNLIDLSAIFVVLIIGYTIVLFSSAAKKSPLVESYLFSGNSLRLATSSSVGAIFSISISFTALLSGGYMYGWQIIFSFWIGIGLAVLFLRRLSRSKAYSKSYAAIQESGAGVSFLSYLSRKNGMNGNVAPYIFLIFLYSCLLAMELAVARSTIGYLSEIDGFNLMLIVVLLAAVTYSYIYIGGYRAVLYTDHFQLMVIAVFIGLCLHSILVESKVDVWLLNPFASKLAWASALDVCLLHISVVFGTFSFLIASVDQWNRTFGTLETDDALSSIYWSSATLIIFAPIPVLIGAHAYHMYGAEEYMRGISNNASLILLKGFLQSSPLSTRFVFLMSLTCVILTTIDTYIITLGQLYYELTVRFRARSHKLYIAELLFKWRELRLVVLIITLGSIIISYNVSNEMVYFFGVATLAGFSFVVPHVVKLVADDYNMPAAKLPLSISMIIALVMWPVVSWLISEWFGSIGDRLYLLSISALISIAIANIEYIYKFIKGRRVQI